MKRNLILFCLLLTFGLVTAYPLDNGMKGDYKYSSGDDSADSSAFIPDPHLVLEYNPPTPLWIPFVEVIGMNTGIWAFNRYVTGAEHAKISMESVKNNFKIGLDWDADALLVNMWGHPFQGSIYYNLARSSGYNYYASLGVTAFGSLQWEFFMEIEPPAMNDFIMTSFGGAMYGEMFYRMSNMILDEGLSGAKRTWTEIGAGIFNPGRLFNRLIYKRSGRAIEPKLYERRRRIGEIAFGANNVADGLDFENGGKNGLLSFDYLYGRPFANSSYKPMDYFKFRMALNFGGEQPIMGQFRIHGIVSGKRVVYGNGSKLIYGIFQYIDYLNNNIYEIAGYSIAPGISWRSAPNPTSITVINLNVGLMPMGAANSEYTKDFEYTPLDSARSYNMGPGGSLRLSFFYAYKDLEISVPYSLWWVHTAQGAPGDEIIGIWEPKITYRIYKDWHIGLQYLLYHRRGLYDDYPDVSLKNNEERLFVSWRFQ
jgi:hypothetical protein